jgi:NADPH-dependent ferric siderophore reductase
MRDIHRVRVLERRNLTPRMVRLTLGGASLVGLAPRPAQDVEMLLPGDQGTVRRRYTIRHARPAAGAWAVDVVLHGAGGPGSRWAARAQVGDLTELIGPRGKLKLRPASHHLFVGDEASLPAIAALSEALPPAETSTAILQVDSPDDELPVAAGHVIWLHRRGRPADTIDLLPSAVERAVTAGNFGQAYVLTEAHTARAIRDLLRAHDLDGDRVFSKGYWNSRSRERGTRTPA